jgi:hypothetical protein
VPCHYQSSMGEKSPVGGDADRYPLPYRDGRRACRTSSSNVLCRGGHATILVKDAKDQATLAEGEAQERVSGVEAESTAALASSREEAEGLVQKIALLKGELAETRQA